MKLIEYQVTKGMRVKVSGSLCDRRAALTMELLERLLETQGLQSSNIVQTDDILPSKIQIQIQIQIQN